MRNLIIASFVLLTACGGEEIYTWGNATMSLSTGFCNALSGCGYYSDDEQREQCIQHSNFHMCEIEGTCNEEIDASVETQVDLCVDDLAVVGTGEDTASCFYLGFFGVVPESCYPVFDADPSRIE